MIRISADDAYRDHPTDPRAFGASVRGKSHTAYGWGDTIERAVAHAVRLYRKARIARRSAQRCNACKRHHDAFADC
jgi:hypothetical protein